MDAHPGATRAAAGQPARTASHSRLTARCLQVMDVLTISRRLGHGSPTITLGIYGHLFGNSDDRAADVIERAFGKVLADKNGPENSTGTN